MDFSPRHSLVDLDSMPEFIASCIHTHEQVNALSMCILMGVCGGMGSKSRQNCSYVVW